MDEKTERILNQDSIADAERLLGKNWQEFTPNEELFVLGLGMAYAEQAKNHMASIGDTYHSIPWQVFKLLLTQNGFKAAYEINFHSEGRLEEEIMYYKLDEGLILWAESYGGDRINSGHIYSEIKANNEHDAKNIIFQWMSNGGLLDKETWLFTTHQDIREGLFSKLNALRSGGVFQSKWIDKKPWLWFLNYTEKEDHDNYRKINAEKLQLCPEEMRKIFAD